MLDALYNVVSIVIWCPFNEGWGQFDCPNCHWIRDHDRTRLVIMPGWFDQNAGDFKAIMSISNRFPNRHRSRSWLGSVRGGYSLKIPGHVWNPEKILGTKIRNEGD